MLDVLIIFNKLSSFGFLVFWFFHSSSIYFLVVAFVLLGRENEGLKVHRTGPHIVVAHKPKGKERKGKDNN